MFRTREGWIKEYVQKGALWIHDGNPKRPHALLTSGMHSNGFFNSRLVIPDDALLFGAASDLVDLFTGQGGNIFDVECVVGPQTGATKLAEAIAGLIENRTGKQCFSASPAKSEEGGKKSMLFAEDDEKFLAGTKVLFCEDVISTGSSIILATEAVKVSGGMLLPFVLALVNRSGLSEIDGSKVIALIDQEMSMWNAEQCLLCRGGSVALRPKENWDTLNQSY